MSMTRTRHVWMSALLLAGIGLSSPVLAQGECLNEEQVPPGAPVVPASNGTLTQISACAFERQYAHVSGINAGGTYAFTSSLGSYITLRTGTYDGPVVAEGVSPLQYVASDNSDLYPHYNVDDACTASNVACADVAVQRILNCTPPTFTYTYVENCELGEFYLDIDVTSTGDGSTVNITYDVFGSVQTIPGVGVGVTQIGPFFIGDQVDLTVEHESDPQCNIALGLLELASNCPTPIACGAPAITTTYCYEPNDLRSWAYQGLGSGTLRLRFLRGTIESNTYDSLEIYDGLDATAPLLFTHSNTQAYNLGPTGSAVNNTLTQYYEVEVYSTTGSLFMQMSSDGSVQCGGAVPTATYDAWEWEVVCLDCSIPTFTTNVVEDCPNNQWSLEVDLTSTGDGSTVNLNYSVNGGGIQSEIGVGVGVTVLGPFVINEEVDLEVAHESNFLCNQVLPTITDLGNCPNLVTCGAPAFTDDYCYTNSTTESWLYTAVGTGTLRLTFIAGSIQSSVNDRLIIYDGVDATGPILFEHVGQNFQNPLAGIQVNTTSGSLYMETVSDAFTSCADGNQTAWEWSVQCLDCLLPAATVSIVEDCPNNQFTLPLDVTSVGDGASVSVSYTVNGGTAQTQTGIGLGQTILGPFAVNDVVNLTLEHENNPLCNIPFGDLTDPGNCPTIIECGVPAIVETYCYEPNDAQEWRYESGGAGTLRLRFLRGTIESNTYDSLEIYDGPDATAPLLFTHNNAAAYNLGPAGSAVNNVLTTFYDVVAYSTTGQLYMEMTADGSVQCGGEFPSATYDSWEWEVVCLDCAIPTGTVTVVDDCANDLFSLDVDVTGTGDAPTATIIYTLNGGTAVELTGLTVGVTTIGPFAFGDVVNVTLAHESNELCNIGYGNFTNTGTCPLLINCDGTLIEDSVCFANNDDLRYYYQSTSATPLGLFITNGTLGFGDILTIYDGGDITAPVLYTSNGGVDLSTVFVSTTNAENRLTLRIQGNGFTSCADGGLAEDIGWQVGCYDCTPPSATFSIVQDCDNLQYFIDVNVSVLGSDAEVEIANDGGLASTFITATGTYQIGPFETGTPIVVTLINDVNSLCNVYSGTLVNPLCPTVLCGNSAFNETYCYVPNENRAWAYEVPAGSTVRLIFQRGTMESNTWDDLTIYDGPDATGTVLFAHTNAATYNFGPEGSAINGTDFPYYGVDVTTTGTNLYMTLTSDGSVQCSTSPTWDAWEWSAQCVGCQAPGVAYNVVEDCVDRSFDVEVIVTEAPSSQGLSITNVVDNVQNVVNATGVYSYGPFELDSTAVFAVADQANGDCVFLSDSLSFSLDSCIISACAVFSTTVCYGNDVDLWYTYQAIENVPISIAFLQGQMLPGDLITLYNGDGVDSPILYEGNFGGNLAGFTANSQNANNILTLRVRSNGSGSCDDGSIPNPMTWDVGCGSIGIEENASEAFSIFPNPTKDLLTIALSGGITGDILVRVLDVSGRIVAEQPYVLKGGSNQTIDLGGLRPGQYMIEIGTSEWTRTQRVQVVR
jgi:hypothetical protein